MSHSIKTVIDDFNEELRIKDLKVWLPAYIDFIDGFDENASVKQFKGYLKRILSQKLLCVCYIISLISFKGLKRLKQH